MDHTSANRSAQAPTSLAKVTRYRKIKNQIIAKLIAASGWLVLLTLAFLVSLLVVQVLPLFADVELEVADSYGVPEKENILLLGDLDNAEPLVTQDTACRINFHLERADTSLLLNAAEKLSKKKSIPVLCSDKLKVKRIDGKLYIGKLSQSGILRIEQLTQSRESFSSQLVMTLGASDSLKQDTLAEIPTEFDYQLSQNVMMIAFKFSRGWVVHTIDKQTQQSLFHPILIESEALTLLPRSKQVVYAKGSRLITYDLRHALVQEVTLENTIQKVVSFPGQRSIFVLFDDNSAQKRSIVNVEGKLRFIPLYTLPLQNLPKTVLFHGSENAVFFVGENVIELYNHVTAEEIGAWEFVDNINDAKISGANLYLAQKDQISLHRVTGLTAVNTWQTVLGKNHYEGYERSEFVWQTTSVTEYSESKYSLIPLIMGSLKASVLALFIAVPLAISAAIYTAYFAPNRLRNWMKPSIEILEAIPSVVLGFVAAIWLAPLAEQFLLTVALFVLLIPLFLFIFAFIHQPLNQLLPSRYRAGWELPIVAFLMLLNFVLASYLGGGIAPEITDGQSAFMADMLNALSNLNKSTLVVALALGIAIVPSIYSLAEDAIYEVPVSLKQASFALGATRLQTLRRVVLLLAYPGILSAITLGLGRAFGETMIVLMVTGNTPVADWDLLAGMRTLTANLAIELPESNVASGQYQVLFLTALVLFTFTFILNTCAELLRQWLRKNYKYA